MIRINSGLYKGRVLRGGKSPLIRPTMSKVKLTFFDILQHDIKEKIFLDGFAGTGNIGIEALSRGAEYVVFIDDLPEAARPSATTSKRSASPPIFSGHQRRFQPLDHRFGQGRLSVRFGLPGPPVRHAGVCQSAESDLQAQRAENRRDHRSGKADRPAVPKRLFPACPHTTGRRQVPRLLPVRRMKTGCGGKMISLVLILGLTAFLPGFGFEDRDKRETMDQVRSRLAEETLRAYEASPFSALSKDYFSRFHLDLEAIPAADEIEIGMDWRILFSPGSGPLTRLMAGELKEFLARSMLRDLPVEEASKGAPRAIFLSDQDGGVSGEKESFTIAADAEGVEVRGCSHFGLRDGVVKLVERLGLRRAPFLKKGEVIFRPRLAVRLGAVPFLGSYRDLLFMGYNAALVGGGNLHALSTSDAIPELRARRRPELLARGVDEAAAARRFGLKTYSLINTQQKFAPDDPLFRTHPEIRGAVTWKAEGDYVLCTEHPLVRQIPGGERGGRIPVRPGLGRAGGDHRRRRILPLFHAALRRCQRTYQLPALRKTGGRDGGRQPAEPDWPARPGA